VVENALKNVLANKEAEIARVRSEVFRLRRNLQLPTDIPAPAAAAVSTCPVEPDASCVLEPAAREAVLAAAIAAKDKPTAVITQLERCRRQQHQCDDVASWFNATNSCHVLDTHIALGGLLQLPTITVALT